MKQFTIFNSDDGIIVIQVDGKTPAYCNSVFYYKDDNGIYHLVDKESGLAICNSRKLKDLEKTFHERELAYETYKRTDAYKIKVERFEKLKLVFNAKGGK